MVTGADVKSGYGYKKEKPYNSIIPYLRAKQAEREQEDYKEPKKRSIKVVTKPEEPEHTLDEYDKARREILAEEHDPKDVERLLEARKLIEEERKKAQHKELLDSIIAEE